MRGRFYDENTLLLGEGSLLTEVSSIMKRKNKCVILKTESNMLCNKNTYIYIYKSKTPKNWGHYLVTLSFFGGRYNKAKPF